MRDVSAGQAPPRSAAIRAGVEYAVVVVAAILAAIVMLQLWNADLRVPLVDRGDTHEYAMTVKAIVEHGGCLTIPELAAPGQLTTNDFPYALDWGHIAAIRALALFTSNWAVVFNLYFILGFPLIAASAFAVFRRFGATFPSAGAGSLLFAFSPVRVLKGEGHLFLSMFFQIPWAVLVIAWVCGERPPVPWERVGGRLVLSRDRRFVAAVLLCLLLSITGLYYAFFAAVLLVVAGAWASWDQRTPRPVLAGATLAAVTAAGLVAGLMPLFLYWDKHGLNPDVGIRLPQEAEMYGLKITQLLLPVPQHRIDLLARLAAGYAALSVVQGDGATSLGVVGGIGFLALLAWVVRRVDLDDPGEQRLRILAVVNLAAILLATIGGFGSLFAWLVSPQIRAYARIAVIIGFLSLLTFFLLLDRITRRRSPLVARIAPLVVLVVGLFDQVSLGAVPPYAAVRAAFGSDEDFVRRIERAVPQGAMIFELPYVSFPEGGYLHRLDQYDLLRPYLHSHGLRWSFPAMRGRFEDLWIQRISIEEPGRLVADLSDADFEGVVIDRPGYADGGADVEAALARLLDEAPEVSKNSRFAFFSLAAHKRAAYAAVSSEEREQRRDRALHPLLYHWGAGFSYVDTGAEGPFRWCGRNGELWIENGSPRSKVAVLSMRAIAGHAPAELRLWGDVISERVGLPEGGVELQRSFVVPSGEHVVRFQCDAEIVKTPIHPRTLVWRAENPTVTEGAP